MAPVRRKEIDNGNCQSRSFIGICAGADFIQQDKRRRMHLLRHLGNVAHVRGESRKIGRNGLLIADIGEYLIEDGKERFARRDVKSHLSHKGNESQGFEHHCFSARIGAADDQDLMVLIKLQRNRNGSFSGTAERVLEKNMPRVAKHESFSFGDLRRRTLKFDGESRFRLCDIQFRHDLHDRLDGFEIFSQGFRNREQNSGYFNPFLLPQTNEIVILVDDGHRFDKSRLTARRKPMYNSGYLIARVGSDGNHEAAIAKSDDLFLNGAALSSKNRLQRPMDAVAAIRQIFSQNPEFRAGIVVDFAVWKNFPVDRGQQAFQVGDSGGDARRDAETDRRIRCF